MTENGNGHVASAGDAVALRPIDLDQARMLWRHVESTSFWNHGEGQFLGSHEHFGQGPPEDYRDRKVDWHDVGRAVWLSSTDTQVRYQTAVKALEGADDPDMLAAWKIIEAEIRQKAEPKPAKSDAGRDREGWASKARALAEWAFSRLIVRTDVFGGYRPGGTYTAHEELSMEVLEKHFRGERVIGAHSTSPDGKCLSVAWDIDAHGDTGNPELNRKLAFRIYNLVVVYGLRAYIFESNGKGGYHVRVFFKKPIPVAVAYWFAKTIVAEHKSYGFDRPPEHFPKQPSVGVSLETAYGNWLRLPGKHHSLDFWMRVFCARRKQFVGGAEAADILIGIAGDNSDKVLAAYRAANPEPVASKPKATHPTNGKPPVNWSKPDEATVREAVAFLGPLADGHYDEWLHILIALHDWDPILGLAIAHEFSRMCPARYDTGAVDSKWSGFTQGMGLTIATVFSEAAQRGWTPPRSDWVDTSSIPIPKIVGQFDYTEGGGRAAAAPFAAAPEPNAEGQPEPETIPQLEPVNPDEERAFWAGVTTSAAYAEAVLDAARMDRLARLRADEPAAFEAIRIGLTKCPGFSARSFKGMLDRIDCDKPKPAEPPIFASCTPGQEEDPHRLARLYLNGSHTGPGGILALRYWRSEFHTWLRDAGSYRSFLGSEVRADVTRVTEEEFRNIYTAHMLRWKMRMKGGKGGGEEGGGEPPKLHQVTTSLVSNVIQALTSLTLVKSAEHPHQPTWLNPDPPWPANEMLPAPNALVHLPSFVAEMPCTMRPTPYYFSPFALGFDFDPNAPDPINWLTFLGARPVGEGSRVTNQLWPDDHASIEVLQEWFGYLLSQDKSQQKILALVGPKRCGKGTILRILKAMIGEANVVNPTLSSLAEHFGLEPLLGKSVAAITDARIGGGTNTAEIVERMLSISGEDDQTVHRKNKEAWTGRLPVRIVVATNDLPAVSDPSGAFANRFIILRFTRSFYGNEDMGLTELLMRELPGILLWAIKGWDRLRERGMLTQPESGVELVKKLESLSSPITAFLEECCIVEPGQQTPRDKLFRRWQEWCKENGRDHSGTSDSFGRNLHSAIPNLGSTRPGIDGKKTYCYVGVGVRTQSGPPSLSRVALWLQGYLSRGESPVGQAIEAAGLSGFNEAKEVFEAAREIEAVMYEEADSSKKFWKLPPSHPTVTGCVDYSE